MNPNYDREQYLAEQNQLVYIDELREKIEKALNMFIYLRSAITHNRNKDEMIGQIDYIVEELIR